MSCDPRVCVCRMLGNGNEGTRHVREAQRKATHNEGAWCARG